MFGHVTSAYMSPVLGRSIALALIADGRARMGEKVQVVDAAGSCSAARIASAVFYDPEGVKQNA